MAGGSGSASQLAALLALPVRRHENSSSKRPADRKTAPTVSRQGSAAPDSYKEMLARHDRPGASWGQCAAATTGAAQTSASYRDGGDRVKGHVAVPQDALCGQVRAHRRAARERPHTQDRGGRGRGRWLGGAHIHVKKHKVAHGNGGRGRSARLRGAGRPCGDAQVQRRAPEGEQAVDAPRCRPQRQIALAINVLRSKRGLGEAGASSRSARPPGVRGC